MSGGKTIAILQSAYIPWKGYFDIIRQSNIFVIYDDVQYSKNHWHNRNYIKTQSGLQWLTISVPGDANSSSIESVRIAKPFAAKHWRAIAQNYARSAYFSEMAPRLRDLYEMAGEQEWLSAVNLLFLTEIARELGFTTEFVRSSELVIAGERSARLVAICQALGADRYISGPSARTYLDTGLFEAAGITIQWMDYGSYRPYRQLHGPFVHEVSIIDLLMNEGPNATLFIRPEGPPAGTPGAEVRLEEG